MTVSPSSTQLGGVDEEAPGVDFRAVFEEQFDYVWCALRRLGVRDADLEDLVHEVFLRVHSKLAQYDARRPIRAWLFGFAYKVAADHRRLARHHKEVLGDPSDKPDQASPADERLVVGERRALLAAALETVPIERRAVIVMHDIDGLPIREVADTLGLPVNTAYSRLRLARAELAVAVKRLRKSER